MLNIEPIKLLKGTHSDTGETGQGCFMNVIAYLNGEPQITDESPCVCFVARPILIWLNDSLPDSERHRMIPYIERAMGSRSDDPAVFVPRAESAAKWAAESAMSAAESAAEWAKWAMSAAKSAASAAKSAAKWAAMSAKSAEWAAKSAKSAAEWAAEWAASAAKSASEWAAKSAESAAMIHESAFELLDEILPAEPKELQPVVIERANMLRALAEA